MKTRTQFGRAWCLSALFLLATTAPTQAADPVYAWANFVGQPGGQGNVDGTGSAARFNNPNGAAVDSAGNVYVADYNNHTIRKVTAAGVVTTLAGSAGSSGSADGTGNAARFCGPIGVAVDSAGNVFVADSFNHTIRRVTPAGVVTTLAGSAGTPGSADGTGGVARFKYPYHVAVDSAGNVYVADYNNHTIRKVTAAGMVTTLAGSAGNRGSADDTGSAARFDYPIGVAVDGAGNLFVADQYNHKIRKVTAAGVVTTLAGSVGNPGSTDDVGAMARFNRPFGVAVDSAGNLFVADYGSVSEYGNNTIRKVTVAGVVTTLAGSAGSSGSADGTGNAARFYGPIGVAVDSAGNVFVADSFNHTIRRVTPAGVVTTLAGSAGISGSADGTGSVARFYNPTDVAVDSEGNVFVADNDNHTIRKVTAAGAVTTLAGSAGTPGSADGTSSAARFCNPHGVTVDSTGTLFVADWNCKIRKVTPAGVVTTLAGKAFSYGSADGTGSAARFNNPRGVAVDSEGNVFVVDGNNTIRKVTAAGVVTTIGSVAGVIGGADGIANSANFSQPHGIAVDNAGDLYVADSGNNRITKGTPFDFNCLFNYTTNNGTITITEYTGSSGAVTIPNTINGLPVTSIGVRAFYGLSSITTLTNVTIPNSITSIENDAFAFCDGLTSVTIPVSVTNIGGRAFYSCSSLSSMTIPDTVTDIGNEAFAFCRSLTSVIISNNVTSIGNEAFAFCDGLTSVTIPSSVSIIGSGAFISCANLAELKVDAHNFIYSSVDGVLFDKNQTTIIQWPSGKTGSYTIPNNVTSIGFGAFYRCTNLTDVIISNNVTNIGDYAFYKCYNLATVVIGNGVTSIGDGTFEQCYSLTNVTIPNSVISIERYAFKSCTGLTSVTIGGSVTTIGSLAFYGCTKLTSITIPDSVPSIESNVFSSCTSLTSVTIPNSVTSIGDYAFSNCTSLARVTIPASITSIGGEAAPVSAMFSRSMSLGDGVVLANEQLPANAGNGAFYNCTSLTEVYFLGNAPTVGSDVFYGADNAMVYYLPGTTGWETLFSGRPTALWNPQVKNDNNFGVRMNCFGFTITNAGNPTIVVEACTNLVNPVWSPVATNTLANGSSHFSDPQWTNHPARFYRFRSP